MKSNTLYLSGVSSRELRLELKKYVLEKDLTNLIAFLETTKYLKSTTEIPNLPSGAIGMIIPTTKYYINVKFAFLAIIVYLLDLNITKGFAAVLASGSGMLPQFLTRINEYNGELCILIESYKNQSIYHENILPLYGADCFNNYMNCSHNCEGKCNFDRRELNLIIDDMISRNILRKYGYKYKVSM